MDADEREELRGDEETCVLAFGDGGALLEGLLEETVNERRLRDLELARLLKEDLGSLDEGFAGEESLLVVAEVIMLLWGIGNTETCLSSASSSRGKVKGEEYRVGGLAAMEAQVFSNVTNADVCWMLRMIVAASA